MYAFPNQLVFLAMGAERAFTGRWRTHCGRVSLGKTTSSARSATRYAYRELGCRRPRDPLHRSCSWAQQGSGRYALTAALLFSFSPRLFRRNCAKHWLDFYSTTSTGHCETLIAFVMLIYILTRIIGLISICQK
jgi:hypothetical protein